MPNQNSKLFCVTGATGLLGNNLVRILLGQGHQVRVAVRKSSDKRPLEGMDLQVRTGDLADPFFAGELLQDVDGLFHCAGYIWFGATHLEQSMRVNVDASINLARHCLDGGTRMIFVSSVDALAAGSKDQPADETCLQPAKGNTAYVLSKREAERRLLQLNDQDSLDIVIVNPGLLIGPYDWKPSTGQMILAVTDGFVPLTPSGGITVTDVRNVARAMISAVDRADSGQRYVLAGDNMTYLELWRRMARLAGRSGPWARMGKPMQRCIGWGGDLVGKLTGHEPQVNSAALQLGAFWNYYNSKKAVDELDYRPGNVDDALRDAWRWMVVHGYSKKHGPS